jgi:hypothetical protein
MTRGRPKGRKITKALASATKATLAIKEMDSAVALMSTPQKTLFESLMSGDDELVAVIKAGYTSWFTGVSKKVTTKDGEELRTSEVTFDNVHDLDPLSYQRLLKLCIARVRQTLAVDDYRQYTDPIKDYFQRFTPLAMGTIVSIAREGKKEETKLRAAQDILDRAGEKATEPEKDVIVPVQVNIQLTSDDGRVTELK